MKIFFLILSMSVTSLALGQINQVANGESIKAETINGVITAVNKIYDIGDVRTSLLTESAFQSRNGTCWVLMKGQNIEGSLYAQVTGRTTLPNADGRFLRNAGGLAAPLATTQNDELKSHTHTQNPHYHLESMGYSGGAAWGQTNPSMGSVFFNNGDGYTANANRNQSVTATNQNTGGDETRPQNLTVNMFVKINNCN